MFLTEGQVKYALSLSFHYLPTSSHEKNKVLTYSETLMYDPLFHSLLLSKGNFSGSPSSTATYPLSLPIAANVCELERHFKVAGKHADWCAPQSSTAKCLFRNFKVNRKVKFLGS